MGSFISERTELFWLFGRRGEEDWGGRPSLDLAKFLFGPEDKISISNYAPLRTCVGTACQNIATKASFLFIVHLFLTTPS